MIHTIPIFETEVVLEFLREIESNSNITQRYLADKYGISLGKVNLIVKKLVDNGLVEIGGTNKSQNRMAHSYMLTPHGVKCRMKLTKMFFVKKGAEYEQLKREMERLDAASKHSECCQLNHKKDLSRR